MKKQKLTRIEYDPKNMQFRNYTDKSTVKPKPIGNPVIVKYHSEFGDTNLSRRASSEANKAVKRLNLTERVNAFSLSSVEQYREGVFGERLPYDIKLALQLYKI